MVEDFKNAASSKGAAGRNFGCFNSHKKTDKKAEL